MGHANRQQAVGIQEVAERHAQAGVNCRNEHSKLWTHSKLGVRTPSNVLGQAPVRFPAGQAGVLLPAHNLHR